MITNSVRNRIIRATSAYLVEKIMNLEKCSRDEAVEMLMETAVYAALSDASTELYLESREFVWEALKGELEGRPDIMMQL